MVNDTLRKVRPLVETLNQKFQKEYKHSNYQSMDELMIKFKGRNAMKQYMSKKAVKRGYKVWICADPVTGCVSQFEVDTRKPSPNDDFASDTLGSGVVKNFCQAINCNEYNVHLLVVSTTFEHHLASWSFCKKITFTLLGQSEPAKKTCSKK